MPCWIYKTAYFYQFFRFFIWIHNQMSIISSSSITICTLFAVANSYLPLRCNFFKTQKVFRIRTPSPNSEHPDQQKKRDKTTKQNKNSWPFCPWGWETRPQMYWFRKKIEKKIYQPNAEIQNVQKPFRIRHPHPSYFLTRELVPRIFRRGPLLFSDFLNKDQQNQNELP